MATESSVRARIKAIEKEMGDLMLNRYDKMGGQKGLQKAVDKLSDEHLRLKQQMAANKWAGSGDLYTGPTYKAQGFDEFDPATQISPKVSVKKWKAPSALDLTEPQLKSLYEACRSGIQFKTHVGTATPDAGSWGHNVGMKDWTTPVSIAEGSPGSLLPPELIPQAWWMRYEPTRLIEHFIPQRGFSMQSVVWLQHYGNSNPAAAVSELAQKPDLGPLVEQKEATFSTIAGMITTSKQMADDFGDWATTIPHEINAAVIDAENYEVLQGSGTSPHFLGLLNTPGTLTRVSPTITSTNYTAIDVLVDAITDIRVNNAYAEADLIVLNPEDWNAIRRIKNTLGSFVLNANSAMQVGEVDNIFGVPVAVTTKMPVGSGLVLDTKIAVLAFLREGMEILFNPWGDYAFQHNAYQWRGEIRETIGVAYPQAINIVTNINYQSGSVWS